MTKVAHILWSAHFGGLERLALDLATCQSRMQGVACSVLFGRGQGEFLERFAESGLSCHTLDLKHGFDLSPRKLAMAREVFDRQDILHFHNHIPALGMMRWDGRRKVVYTEHGNFGFGRRRQWKDVVKRFLAGRFMRRHADFISFNSKFTQKVARGMYGLESARQGVVYNGIDFSSLHKAEEPLDPGLAARLRGCFVVGTLSRLAGFKRIDRLISAFARFKGAGDARLLLVGDGVLRAGLEAQARDLGVADRVIFTGFKSNVRAHFEAMDICVFPSQREPFGLVAVESLGLGKPTLAFADVGGMAEILEGVCAEDIVESEEGLSRRMEHYHACRERIPQGAGGRVQHARRFSIERMAEEFEGIYRELLSCAE